MSSRAISSWLRVSLSPSDPTDGMNTRPPGSLLVSPPAGMEEVYSDRSMEAVSLSLATTKLSGRSPASLLFLRASLTSSAFQGLVLAGPWLWASCRLLCLTAGPAVSRILSLEGRLEPSSFSCWIRLHSLRISSRSRRAVVDSLSEDAGGASLASPVRLMASRSASVANISL